MTTSRRIFTALSLVLVLVLFAVALGACGASATATPAPAPTEAPAATTAPAPAETPTQAAVATQAPPATEAPTAAPAITEPPAPTAAPTAATAVELPAPPGGGTPKLGGTITIAFQSDIPTLDPALGQDFESWPAMNAIYNGLLMWKKAAGMEGATPVPDLAEALPEVSADGKTYTFKLRQGVQFTNGREVEASDVKYTIERNVDPKTKGLGANFFTGISGAKDFAAGKATEITGIKTPDKYTVSFTLENPDATFIYKMTSTFAYIVPKEEVAKYGEEYSKHPVGTGPFMLKEWVAGQKVTFVRNPTYFKKPLPYADQVVFVIGNTPDVEVLKLEKGEVDLLGDGLPGADYVRVKADPNLSQNLVEAPVVNVLYLTLNTEMAPLDNPKVRQAINYAINKDKIIKIINGRGQKAVGIIPPLMPGYSKDTKGYDYDPKKAEALLKEAGQDKGFSTTLYIFEGEPYSKVGESIQQDLSEVGIKVENKVLAFGPWLEAVMKEKTAPLAMTFWGQDYPDQADYWDSLIACSARGAWNLSRYCDPEVDKTVEQGKSTLDNAARYKIWNGIEQKVMDEAAFAPLYYQVETDLHSPDLGGYYIHPVWGLSNVSATFEDFYKIDGK